MTSVPPVIRGQADFVVALRDPIKASVRRLHEYFFGVFPTASDFQRVLNKATENFGALVVNNRSRSSALIRCVFTYKAVEHEAPSRLCCDAVWEADRLAQLRRRLKGLEAEEARKILLERGGLEI